MPTIKFDESCNFASYTEVEKVLDYREQEVMEVVHEKIDKGPEADANDNEEASNNNNGNNDNVGDDMEELPTSASYEALLNVPKKEGDGPEGTETGRVTNNSIFQPAERCRRVLEKIWEDPYSLSFQDPVDTQAFPDYLETITEPICLSDIKKKLEMGEYSRWGTHRVFAQDMRKIWRNCKLYNLYQSQIWQCAHALSLLFERLYQAWVVSYSDASMPMSNPLARPWELSCRVCSEEGNDEMMILCDHCDAPFHIFCLEPKLDAVPEDSWICPRCIQWLKRTGSKVLTATMEDEARKLVDGAKTQKVVKVKQKKYLVKWRGLSFSECTWETAEDINDDQVIADYHKLNDAPPDEPPLTQAEIGLELAKDRKDQLLPAGMKGTRENPIMDLDAQIYAQIRAFHFLKWKKMVPDALMRETGPAAYAGVLGGKNDMALPRAVLKKVHDVSVHAQKVLADKLATLGAADEDENDEEEVADDGEDTYGTENDSVDFAAIKEEIQVQAEVEAGADGRTRRSALIKQQSSPAGESKPSLSTPVNDARLEGDRASASKNDPKGDQDEVSFQNRQLAWYVASLSSGDPVRHLVADRLSEMVYAVARDHEKAPLAEYPTRPALPSRYQAPSEVEACVAKGDESLCMRIGNFHGKVIVLGFKQLAGGARGPVERTNKVRIGDILVAVDGLYIYGMTFSDTLKLLSSKQPFMYLRFLRYPPCKDVRQPDAVSKYFEQKPPSRRSFNPHFPRSRYHGVYPCIDMESYSQYSDAIDTSGAEASNLLKVNAVSSALKGAKAIEAAAALSAESGQGLHDRLRWVAEYYNDFERVQVDVFDDEDKAARAYDAAVASESCSKYHRCCNYKSADGADEAHSASAEHKGEAPNDTLTSSAALLGKVVNQEREVSVSRLNSLHELLLFKRQPHVEMEPASSEPAEEGKELSSELAAASDRQKVQNSPGSRERVDTGDAAAGSHEGTAKAASECGNSPEARTTKDTTPMETQDSDKTQAASAGPGAAEEKATAERTGDREGGKGDADSFIDEELSDFHSLDSQDSDSEFEERRLKRRLRAQGGSEDRDADDEEENEEEENEEEDEDAGGGEGWADDENDDVDWVPNSNRNVQSEVTQSGPITRLLRAVDQSDYPPIKHEWTKYILEMCVEKHNASAAADADAASKLSSKTRRVDQIDMANGEIVRSWESVNTAARTMKLKAADIFLVLAGKTDQAGGFKWEYSRLTSADTAKMSIEEIEAEEALEEVS